MAGRAPLPLKAWLRSFGAATRSVWRSGRRFVGDIVRHSAATPAAAQGSGWSEGVATAATATRRYRFFRPPALPAATPLPLLVMLHGCSQDAERFARSTRMHRFAVRAHFCLLFPEQARQANAQGCWNWFETRNGRVDADADAILAAIDAVCTQHGADQQRVSITGLSAGATMAVLLVLRHPQRFAAVAMHSGVAPGSAHSTATALAAMQGRRQPAPLPADGATLPPLLVIQGRADRIVRPSNGRAAAQLWAAAAGAQALPARIEQRGTRHAMTVTDYKSGTGLVARLCEIDALAHAWSGGAPGQLFSDPNGPNAARLIWSFAERQFRRVR